MAITESNSPALSDLARQNELVGAGGDPVATASSKKDSAKTAAQPPSSEQQQQTPNRPSLVPLGSNQPTPAAHKKFSAVNIGKKFLEKNAQSAAASTAPNNTSGAKTSAAAVRPVAQTAPSHSRLVTAKLTATQFATSPAGWSRPSSAAPASTPGNNSAAGTPPASNSKAASPAPQQQHQQHKEGGAKPVWGNVKPAAAPVRPDIRQDDFPTAAEAVKGAAPKQLKPELEKPEPTRQASTRAEDADTFRGVHLDPNAHHWDEMEEDDDDFLGGVVEFGDGRQYKVEESKVETPNIQDRDADDFDRSWPKSRSSPTSSSNRDVPVPASTNEPARSPSFSTSGLHSASPRGEPPRALFNERSNRLEPYSHGRPGPLPPQGRPNEPPVRVLHKPPSGPPNPEPVPRNRRFSGASATSSSAAMPSPRDATFFGRGGPPSPRLQREPMAQTRSFSGRSERGTMGPPPVPAHALKVANAAGRPLPPHMAQQSNENQPPPARPTLAPVNTNSTSIPSQSPKSVAGPLTAATPLTTSAVLEPSPVVPPGVDVDEARKELMQTAAARAKQRREQEEAEREAQKERARKKAQELEEKMKALEDAKAKEAETQKPPAPDAPQAANIDAVVADTPKDVTPATPSVPRRPGLDGAGPRSFSRPTGFPADSQPPRRPSFFGPKENQPPGQEPSSWRTKAGPPTPIGPPPAIATAPAKVQVQPARRPSTSGFVASTTLALDSAVDGVKEDLEVVDFSDMAKLVGGETPKSDSDSVVQQEAASIPAAVRRTSRPVASDFFEDATPASSNAAQEAPKPVEKPPVENAWRRKPVIVPQEPRQEMPTQEPETEPPPPTAAAPASQVISSATAEKQPPPPLEQPNGRQPGANHSPTAPPRTPRNQGFYKDANLSSLDHAMSRIKGAMKTDGPPGDTSMSAPSKSSLKPLQRDRWVPPALRNKTVNFVDEEHHEVFAVTAEEPSLLDESEGSNNSLVNLPTVSIRRDPIKHKQLATFHRPPVPVRLEILCFEPPVEGMKRDLSINAVLFKRPMMSKGQIKYRVCIPRWRGPRPNMGSRMNSTVGSFVKPAAVADGVSSWRKPAAASVPEVVVDDVSSVDTGLQTQSRSPPPVLMVTVPENAPAAKPSEPTPTKGEGGSVLRPRAQPKMPAGSAVAFKRDSRIDVADGNMKPSVNFIVSDELEETSSTQKDEPQPPPQVVPTTNASSPAPISGPSPQPAPTAESKASESSGDRATQPSPWSRPSVNLPTKDVPARGPDPESIKALWSQKSEKPQQLQPVNSLEGIADDLTPIPFSFPAVKSESGSTPPPPNGPQAPPSRMSLHDVTRAFQTVPQPAASSTAPSRPAISPPSTNAPVARPTPSITTANASSVPPNPGYSYVPIPPPNGRPGYGSYPSPMMGHSPAPGMAYSPIRTRWRGAPYLPVWL